MGKLGEIINHPEEIWPLLQLYQQARVAKRLPKDETWRYCYGALNATSRSFALVIQQLPAELKDAVCIFYLVLRALDTVEDDMSMAEKVKLPALRSFHENIGDRGFTMECEGKPTDKDLMKNYCHVADAYLKLSPSMQEVIKEITKRMGNGMADFIEKDVDTIKDWDLYCHYVAGLVGVGLSQLFSASEREGGELAEMEDLANHMGLFLQKTNIIRDYLEDITEEPAPRMFWPKEIWGNYATELSAFKEPENLDGALKCLNHMVSNALGHIEPCFEYMIRLRDPQVFAFCAIPQLMAMSTLSLCFNNPEVFKGVVKMRRGETAKLIIGLNGLEGMYRSYLDCAETIGAKCQGVGARNLSEGVMAETLKQLERVETICKDGLRRYAKADQVVGVEEPIELWVRLGVLFLFGGYFVYAWSTELLRDDMGVKAFGDTRLDYLQKFIAIFMLIFGLFIAITGKRF